MIMANRIVMTDEEKMAQKIIGNGEQFNMGENHIEDIIARNEASKYNNQVDEYAERLKTHIEGLQKVAEEVGSNVDKMEIKPMFNKILIKPFEQNPFQKVTIDKATNLIIDTGGFDPGYYKSQDTGKFEQEETVILTGAVQEVGPDCKYLQPGDVVFYDKRMAMPVPFFKQGLWLIGESAVISVVNEGLEERFKKIKKNGRE